MFRQNWRRAEYVGWYDDPNLGGMSKTLTDMINADPNFVLGRAFAFGLNLIGTAETIRLNDKLKDNLNELQKLAKKHENETDDREKKHVNAVVEWAHGNLIQSTRIWEDILIDHPTDMLALKFAHDTYFYLGKQKQMRDSVARVVPVWKLKSPPLSNYIHGMFAFGLEETNFYAAAEKEAKEGIAKYAYDGWAYHSLAHVYEMQGQMQNGIKLLSSNVNDWNVCNSLACHNYWHWALYHIEQEEYDAAIELFNTEVGKRAFESKMMLDIVDVSSLLYRLDILKPGQYVQPKHWDDIYSIVEPHLKDHILGFNDAHFLMACLGSNHRDEAQELLKTLTPDVASDHWYRVTSKLLEGMIEFNDGNYGKAVEILREIRYDIVNMGGSDAQRDVFNQLLIVASLKSPQKCHKSLCQSLIREREAIKTTPLSRTLMGLA